MKAMRANLGPTVLRAHPGMRTRRSLKGTRLPHPGKWHLPNRQIPTTKGRLLAEGSPDEIQRNQAVQDAYLGGMREHESA